ncbi:MAG TPA: crossover junction endodeoxyribonuclease RuvC [Clostridiaceae bacterium]|jgi:crossover junction endodeoxyribonuclease RuvC|nr:crossover junction endodeoxyribonuclease RuvC [Clostridiaceae bacterium]
MIILGIDPGYAITGYGIVELKGNRIRPLVCGVLRTAAKTPFPERLLRISDGLTELISTYNPDCMAVEELFFARNTTTAIGTAQARGVAVLVGAKAGIPVFEYTPVQVKSAVVGYGKADKNQVQEMVKRLLNLAAVPKPDDAADALALAICHAHTGNRANFLAVGGYQ